jgi:hypothetical protein
MKGMDSCAGLESPRREAAGAGVYIGMVKNQKTLMNNE